MSSERVRIMVDKAKLTEAFPQEAIKVREGKFRYVEGHTVIHRLIDATDNTYGAEIKSFEMRPWGKSMKGTVAYLVTCHVSLTIPGLGTRDSVGVQVVYEGSGEDLLKGAETDGLKKAATKFGVGLELYGPDYAEAVDSAPVPQITPAEWKEILDLMQRAYTKEQATSFMMEMAGTTDWKQMTARQAADMLQSLKETRPRQMSEGEWKKRLGSVVGNGVVTP